MSGAVVWFLRHMVTVTIPGLTDAFTQTMKEERAQCQRHHEEILERMEIQHEQVMRELWAQKPSLTQQDILKYKKREPED